MTNQSAEIAAAESQGELYGYFVGALLFAFLLSRLGLYLRRSSRHQMSTVAGVHLICFFFLAIVSCAGTGRGPPGVTILFAQLSIFLIDYFRLPDPAAHRDDEPQRASSIRPLGYVAIGAALLFGLAATVIAKKEPMTEEMQAAEVERGMASTEAGKVYVDFMRREFPAEHRDMMASMAKMARENGSKGITPELMRRVDRDISSRLDALLAKYRPAVARAPTDSLNTLARAIRNFILQAQKEAPEICAAYALGSPTRDQLKAMPESMRLPAARMTVAMLAAGKAGQARPVQRDLSKPPRALDRLTVMVDGELGPSLGNAIGDPEAIAALPARDKCRMAAAYFSLVPKLTSEEAAAVTAYDFSL